MLRTDSEGDLELVKIIFFKHTARCHTFDGYEFSEPVESNLMVRVYKRSEGNRWILKETQNHYIKASEIFTARRVRPFSQDIAFLSKNEHSGTLSYNLIR